VVNVDATLDANPNLKHLHICTCHIYRLHPQITSTFYSLSHMHICRYSHPHFARELEVTMSN